MRLYLRHILCYMFSICIVLLHIFVRYAFVPDIADTLHNPVPCMDCFESPPQPGDHVLRFESRDLQQHDSTDPVHSDGQLSMPSYTYPNRTDILREPHHWTSPQLGIYQFACSNIEEIAIKRKIGQGVTKQVYLGLHSGQKVAVKMVTRNVIDVLSCLKVQQRDSLGEVLDQHKCYTMPNMKLMKEILLLHQLQHPNLLPLLGYCVRSEETESTSLQEHGIVAVYEYGLRFYVSSLRDWPWKLRIKTAIELADLLDYLSNSPLGSMRISDFKDAHFLLKDGRIKLTDLDDVTSLEPSCRPPKGSIADTNTNLCGYGLQCIGGICPGYNALKNIDNFNQLFFKNLLNGDSYEIESQLSRIRARLDSLSLPAGELKTLLYKLNAIPHKPGYS